MTSDNIHRIAIANTLMKSIYNILHIASGSMEATHLAPGVEATHPSTISYAYIYIYMNRETIIKNHVISHNPMQQSCQIWCVSYLIFI